MKIRKENGWLTERGGMAAAARDRSGPGGREEAAPDTHRHEYQRQPERSLMEKLDEECGD